MSFISRVLVRFLRLEKRAFIDLTRGEVGRRLNLKSRAQKYCSLDYKNSRHRAQTLSNSQNLRFLFESV